MSNYRCGAGHVSSMVFAADQLKQPCPVCEITVYKFVALVNAEEVNGEEVAEERVGLSATVKNRRNALIFAIAAIVLGVAAWGVKRQQFAPVAVSASAPVLPVSSAVVAKPPAIHNNIAEVRIQDFQASMQDDGVVRAAFVLVNSGGSTNDYPSLMVHWKGSAAPGTLINNTSYAHPTDAFTKVAVVTDLKAPEDATGIEITLQYD